MKKIKLASKDAYELATVMAVTIREQSEKLDFKEVINLQKTVNYIISCVQKFSDGIDRINKDKQSLVEVSNKKISEFKNKLQTNSDKKGEIDEKYKEKLDVFVNLVLEEANEHIAKEISPQYEALYSGIGEEMAEFELEDEKQKILVINFEKYAKEKYNNKSKMVEVYESLIAV